MGRAVSSTVTSLLVAMFVLLPQALADSPSIDLKTNQIRYLSYKADHILSEMQKTSDALHLRFVGPTHFVPDWGTIDDNQILMTGVTIRLDSFGHSFTFTDSDSRFNDYQNRLYDELPENQVLYDEPDKPKWSKEQAIAIATAFKKIFVEPTDALLGPPRAEYTHTSFEPSKSNKLRSRLGMWMISWPRVDGQGHPFFGDHVTIQIQEGFAPLGAGAWLTTPYSEEKTAPISESDALNKAEYVVFWRQLWEKIFYRCVLADEYQRNIVGDDILSKQLTIVLPNRNFFGHLSKASTKARLVWEIWFRPRHSSKPPASGWWDEDFSVWIDAHTGSVIGGDAML